MLGWLFRGGKGRAGAQAADVGETPRLLDLALQRHQAGQLQEAQALYREVLERDPGNIDALHFSGVVAYQRGEHDEAEALIVRALERNASNPAAQNNLGNVLSARGRLDEAAARYRRAITLQPDYVDAHVNLGSVLVKQEKLEEAAACYESGLAVVPHSARLHFNLATVLTGRGSLEDGVAGFRKALSLKQDYPEAYNGMAAAFMALARVEDAEKSYRKALALKPDFGQARFGYALARLMQGDYATGFALLESRFDKAALTESIYAGMHARVDELRDVPRWLGEDATGKALLVWTDQGFGDTLMFLRYLRLLKRRGFGKLIVQCEPPFMRLVQTLPEVDKVVSGKAPVPFGEFDCHCPISSLPLAFATRLDTIPAQVPYLFVPPAMKEEWGRRLAGVGPLRVGLVWAGRSDFTRDALRRLRLQQFSPLFEVDGVAFVSLQKGDPAAQRIGTAWTILDWMDECNDLLDTAALMEQLDLVISVDTGMVHLAGALGRPVWVLNRFESDWRWGLEREDCAWYPTMRIFRQQKPGDWDGVMQRVAGALRNVVDVGPATRCGKDRARDGA